MRMRQCPHCGAQNSVKRVTCYQCQQPLEGVDSATFASGKDEQSTGATPGPASRWEALEPVRGQARRRGHIGAGAPEVAMPTAPASVEPPPVVPISSAPLKTAKQQVAGEGASRRYIPTPRSALKHVRTMGVFFREIYTLTKAGISIGPACRELERRAPRQLRELAREMASAAESGRPVSTAMESRASLFYPWHLGVIRAAEVGGFLPEAFEQIARAYETEWETRAALRMRLFIYTGLGLPAILVTLPLIMTIAQPIPHEGWTPELVLATVGRYFRIISLPIALGLLVLTMVWQILQATAWFQGVQQRAVIRLPVVGRVARAASLDRYLATLGLMLRGGLPIAQAAEEAAMAAGNAALSPKLLALIPALRRGEPLSSLLIGTRMFDADTMNMAATGEVSGTLPDMLARAAGYYREDGESKRRLLIRASQVLVGMLWLAAIGVLIAISINIYFSFAFRFGDWMMEGFE